MECWNNDLKGMIFLYSIHINKNFTITQYSNCDLPARALQWQTG